MRKTKKCTATAIQTVGGRLTVRTCVRERGHEDKHMDERGAWEGRNNG